MATGHYGRVDTDADGRTRLLRAADEHKDQTYFLWRVGKEVLAKTLFPIGDIPNKSEVRRMVAERGLGLEAKPDSDGICFIGPVGIRTFLLDTLERRAGDVVELETGRVLGHHDGAFLFTVGQRRGLDLGGGPARYVVRTDVQTNTVYVTADRMSPALFTNELALGDCRWIAGEPPAAGEYIVRTRHTGELVPCVLEAAQGGASASIRRSAVWPPGSRPWSTTASSASAAASSSRSRAGTSCPFVGPFLPSRSSISNRNRRKSPSLRLFAPVFVANPPAKPTMTDKAPLLSAGSPPIIVCATVGTNRQRRDRSRPCIA